MGPVMRLYDYDSGLFSVIHAFTIRRFPSIGFRVGGSLKWYKRCRYWSAGSTSGPLTLFRVATYFPSLFIDIIGPLHD